ncbi:MAG TPA: ester cyclase [Usitatibacter sp.]|nr:ester cyclase [Usitatibacter sp.]
MTALPEPEKIVRAMFTALNERDYARVAGAIAEHCEWWSMPAESLHRGPSAIVAGLREFSAAFPDWRADIERVTAAGPIVVAEWASSGTFRHPFRGREPNGRAFKRRGCSVADVQGGKIVHYRDYYDRASMLQQLGLIDLL